MRKERKNEQVHKALDLLTVSGVRAAAEEAGFHVDLIYAERPTTPPSPAEGHRRGQRKAR
eukprot:1653137-Pleurochrysis_carterae.AAC.3